MSDAGLTEVESTSTKVAPTEPGSGGRIARIMLMIAAAALAIQPLTLVQPVPNWEILDRGNGSPALLFTPLAIAAFVGLAASAIPTRHRELRAAITAVLVFATWIIATIAIFHFYDMAEAWND